MPLLLRCDELKPGMRLVDPLMWKGRKLLSAGKVLTHADVDALRRHYADIFVRVGDPILDLLVDFEDDTYEREVATTVQKRIANAMSDVVERFSSRASIHSLNIAAVQDTVANVLGYLDEHPVSAALLNRTLDAGSPLTEHAGNVFYLSMLLGCSVRDYVDSERRRRTACRWLDPAASMNLLPLGLGAMLADVGMIPLRHLYEQREPLTEEDRQAIRQHPDDGAGMLPYEMAPVARAIVRTHHENYDGSGYAAGLVGDRIHVFSRIVRIADAYDAATASHMYKEAKSPARALWEMSVGPYTRFYDPVLMKVFTRLIQPFPIGARVRLCDGRYAVVVSYNREDPFKPTILIAFDTDGQRLSDTGLEGPLSLAQRQDLQIQSFGDEELSYLHGTTPADEAPVTRKDFTSLFEAVFP